VRGYLLCAAHLCAALGSGICNRTTTDGKKCPNTRAKGMQACAMHVLQAAAALGHGPPTPGEGLTSGPSLDENVVIEPTKPTPAVPPPKTASKYTVSEALQCPPQDFRGGHLPLPTAVLTTLGAWRHESNWSPPTWSRTHGAALGALPRASLYTTSVGLPGGLDML
jgi:hypothetical protein